jgi:hypothetical protein
VNPSWTSFQGVLTGAAIFVLAVLGETPTSATAATCAAVALLLPLALNWNYARVLAQRPRSEPRARGDRRIALAVAVAIPLPLAYAATSVYVDALRLWPGALRDSAIRAFVACTLTIALELVFLSSTVDWYAIKAWRDGIVAEPPCRRGSRPTWLNVTRWWLVHRIIATVAFFVGLSVIIDLGWFEIAKHYKGSDWAYFLVGLVSPTLLTALVMRGYLTNLWDAIGLAVGNLQVALGDTVTFMYHGRSVTGVVYDVSIDGGYRVLESDGSSRYLPLADVRKDRGVDIDQRRPPPWACDAACQSEVEDACDFRRLRDRPSSRWLIF